MEAYLTPEYYLMNSIKDVKITSVLDVGVGHSGVFNYWYWQSQKLTLKACLDVCYIRPDIDGSWHKVIASATNLPFKDSCFDLAQSTEMIEHVSPKRHVEVLSELIRVAAKAVFLTSSDITAHLGDGQRKAEEKNPFQKYLGIVDIKLLKNFRFRILLHNGHKIKAFLRL